MRSLAAKVPTWSVMAATLVASGATHAAPGDPRIAGGPDLVENALRASGYVSAPALRRARAEFERYAGPLVRDLTRVTEPARQAELLLKALHRKGGLLGRYDARATTLRDILDRRAYNCVSASVLYNLIAHRLSLPVAAQLLPTHARSMLSLERGGRLVSVVVETTSPDGFDPNPTEQAAILASVSTVDEAAGRALVAESGAIVDTSVLIGTIYVNRASIAQEAGRLERAEQLFALGQTHAPQPSVTRVLIDQRAALLSQLAADDIMDGRDGRLERALRSLKAAVRLAPANPEIAGTVQHNLRALAQRLLRRKADGNDEAGVTAVTRQFSKLLSQKVDRAAIRAFAMGQIASIRMRSSDIEGAIRHLERGLAEPLGGHEEALRRSLATNLVTSLRTAAVESAGKGDGARAKRYLDKLDALSVDTTTESAVRADHRRVVHLLGERRIERREYEKAAAIYREGLTGFPEDDTMRHNLVFALEQLTVPVIDAGRCERAAVYFDEIQRVDPTSTFPTQAKLRCILNRARSRLSAGNFAEAVRLIRSVDPEQATVRHNLSVALLRWTAALARAGRCGEAKDRAKEAGAVFDVGTAAVQKALGHCR